MVTLINKNRQNLKRFETHRPKCRNCGKDLYEYIQQKGAKVWGQRRGTGVAGIGRERKARLYCDDCKKDLFEGVKLRKEIKTPKPEEWREGGLRSAHELRKRRLRNE